MKAKSGHPWLAERRKGDLGVKCQLKGTSGHPWLAERRQPGREVSVVGKELPAERRKEATWS